jgi:hypothetical protein
MKHRSKLSPEQQHAEQQSAAQVNQQQSAREFATAEEMLGFDASQTSVPPQIAERLKQSIAAIAPPPHRSWWQNLFGK